MTTARWYGAAAGFASGLLFMALASVFTVLPAVRAALAGPGVFSWMFILFCALCFIIFSSMPRIRKNIAAGGAAPLLLFFAGGAFFAYLLLLLVIGTALLLWQPQVL